jgi:hypothetical protein
LDSIALTYAKTEHDEPIKVPKPTPVEHYSVRCSRRAHHHPLTPLRRFGTRQAVSLSNIKSAQRTKDAQFEVVTNLFMENRKPRTFILRVSRRRNAYMLRS